MNIDKTIEFLKNKNKLPIDDLKTLLKKGTEVLKQEINVIQINAPVAIVGDLHGKFDDLLNMFLLNGEVENQKYVFMGDYVNRGLNSILCFAYLIALKIKYPERITLLRGNHESRKICEIYGLVGEIEKKYSSIEPFEWFVETFQALPLAAVVNGSVICIHGGLSSSINTINDIETINRFQEIPSSGSFCDLVWSDPTDEIEDYKESPRGAGILFGKKVLESFLDKNNLTLLVRAHQLVQSGYKYDFGEKCLTVWSVPNYCNRCSNSASVFHLDENLTRSFKHFETISDF
ncbi:serine/threonine-protein phosphatase 6 catalytic subunit [Anaeramoeba flamelloides]|uniref:Serine/threonine-protein phosphatase n=1 Tax=Anaeramoeba flamelloides TaxID=1746091 RepID=A0ABQ8YMP0_9EUKA|nr:serine/threonine-protein phosphatase 6 catalytic subunit [Anaeramoeba flamelloides]